MKFPKKFLQVALILLLVLSSSLVLSGCGASKDDEGEDVEQEQEDENTIPDREESEDTESEEETENNSSGEDTENNDISGDFSRFTSQNQKLGDSVDNAMSAYTLSSITDSTQSGFHRFIFKLSSTSSDLADIEAQLVSSGGYIRVRLDRVTKDETGIIYQGSREINRNGVLKLYHAVTPNESEEVYQIGIAKDTVFYLHSETDKEVILDVKYPGEVETGSTVEDSMEFTANSTTLSGTNTAGDAKLSGYSWSTESTLLKFIWNTTSSSGNPTPPTQVTYNASNKTITVVFTDVQSDSVIGSDGVFSTDLGNVVSGVSGSRAGTTSTFVFQLTKETTYRIYRSTSPNQVILDVKR